MFISQMKQSLEKLHRGIGVPEVQQDPPDDTLTESLTEAWAPSLLVTTTYPWLSPISEHNLVENRGLVNSDHNTVCSFPRFQIESQERDTQGELHYPQLSSPDWLEMATLAFSLNQ